MRYWLWWVIWLSSCQPTPPAPPLSEDTTVVLLREIYAVRAALLPQALSPAATESLLSLHTYHILKRHSIDTTRWEALRRYYAQNPQRWHTLLEKALSTH